MCTHPFFVSSMVVSFNCRKFNAYCLKFLVCKMLVGMSMKFPSVLFLFLLPFFFFFSSFLFYNGPPFKPIPCLSPDLWGCVFCKLLTAKSSLWLFGYYLLVCFFFSRENFVTKKLFLKDCFGVAEHKTLAIYPFYFLEKCWFSDFGISFWQSLIYCEELRDDLKLTMCPGDRRTEQSESSRLRLSISLYG